MKPTRSLRPRVKLNRAAVSELLSLLNTTQTELAQMCGLSPGYFSLLMAGKRSPSAGARGPILTPSESCASGTSPAAPGHCCRRCTTRLPPATSVPEETRLGLHTPMMEEVLYGCDVMPSAAHITSATLSGAQPTIGFKQSRIYTMPYGRQKDGTVRIGSLELLQSSHLLSLFNTNDPALRTGSAGEETAAQINIDIPDASFDLVIMNPPFTRNVTREGATADAVAAAFAAFGASERDQRDMAKRMGELKGETCYHGNAGMASAFAALAHRKLRPGGVLALVLPLSSASGLAWQNFRQMLGTEYIDRTVLSIAANGKDMSFSSDTGMAECLVIARKMDVGTYSPTLIRTQFTSLRRRPQGFAHAAATARNIVDSATIRGIEDGPYGGTPPPMGEEISGEMLTAPQPDNGENWGSGHGRSSRFRRPRWRSRSTSSWSGRVRYAGNGGCPGSRCRALPWAGSGSRGQSGQSDPHPAGRGAVAGKDNPMVSANGTPVETERWGHRPDHPPGSPTGRTGRQ